MSRRLENRDVYSYNKAKQRASIKWLLSKAYNHRTPEELREPFYKDHDDVEHLKPHIVRALANAELYCMALSHLYADPNFHNLNHWGIIQALARKGICVAEPSDCSLTETVLIQTNPLRMSAHMAVTEALMSLFIKEQVSIEKVMSTVKRYSAPLSGSETSLPTDQEEALLMWLKRSCEALKKKIEAEIKEDNEENPASPKFPKINDLSDLSDGVGITSVVSLYCPEDLQWSEIALGDPPSMADSLYNIQLIQRFCKDRLPFNLCHLSIEDIVYMHDSIRQNVICFLADIFVALEVKPVIRSIQLPGVKKDRVIEVPDPDLHRKNSPTGLKRLASLQERCDKIGSQPSSLADQQQPQEEDSSFVVQRGRTVPTLSSVVDKNDKEQLNKDTKSEELGESSTTSNVFQQMQNIPVAGRPSDAPRRSSIYSRTSSGITNPGISEERRNSVDDNASQLSLENLGGSQDNLSILGRNPDKEMRTHSGRLMPQEQPVPQQQPQQQQLLQQQPQQQQLLQQQQQQPNNDRYIDNKELEEMAEKNVTFNKAGQGADKVSFADLRRQKARDQFHTSGINITYTEQEKEDLPKRLQQRRDSTRESALMTTTANNATPAAQAPAAAVDLSSSPDAMALQLNTVRLKLEQRRKRIEEEKRKMETVMARQREKDVGEDLSAVQSRWLSDRGRGQPAEARTPDIEAMDMDTYSKSLYAMNDSLHDLQSDIQRLAQQQSQIQQMMHTSPSPNQPQQRPAPSANPMDPQPFYISQPDQPPPPTQRRTWGQPQPISFAHQHVPGGPMEWPQQPPRRSQWGSPQQQPRPMMSTGYGYGYNDLYMHPDQWGQQQQQQQQQMHHHHQQQQQQQQQPSGYNGHYSPQQPHPGYGGYNNPTYNSPYSGSGPPPVSTRTPFRLHEGGSPGKPGTLASRRLSSEPPVAAEPSVPLASSSRPTYSRQNSRDSVSGTTPTSPSVQGATRRLHTSVPAPEEDDMAPQNVSFIDSSADDEQQPPHHSEVVKKKLPERLSQLNITSGSKTYRVHHGSDKETSPSPTRTRPTISSAFKQSKESGGSGPSSIRSNSAHGLTEEEAETLAVMKTEKLKDDADASKGFVISFDDDTPTKPKPQLKQRKLSSKKNSLVSEMSSDGSNSSRKENLPPAEQLMICIDMNTGDDSTGSGGDSRPSPARRSSYQQRKYLRNGGSPTRHEPAAPSWLDQHQTSSSSGQAIPRFEVDPEVPLETMVALNAASESESDGGGRGTTGLIIGDDIVRVADDHNLQEEMQRKKEKIMMQSLRRKQQAEENRIRKNEEERRKREAEAKKEELKVRKKEEDKARKEAILEQYKLKKEFDKQEEENSRMPEPVSARPVPKLRAKSASKPPGRPRPKTIHVDQDGDVGAALASSRGPRGSSSNISANRLPRSDSRNSINDSPTGGGGLSLAGMGTGRHSAARASGGGGNTSRPGSRRGSTVYIGGDDHTGLPPSGALPPKAMDWAARQAAAVRRKPSNVSTMSEDSPRVSRLERSARSVSQPRGKRDSSVSSAYGGDESRLHSRGYRGSRESLHSGMTYNARRGSNASMYNEDDYYYGGSMRDLSNRHGTRRKSSSASHLGPGSLPGYARRRAGGEYDDGASDISSTSGFSAYGYRSGTRLYREPATKSNRTIVLNAIEYVVFPGVVNAETRNRVLDVIDRCDCPHFLLLFRDAKCQFRGLYAYYPDTEEVYKIYGTGPKQVTDNMFETFFKYNSGGKKFTKIHTKHLTVTIDAFTIHNSLWMGKKAHKLPDKKDMALVV